MKAILVVDMPKDCGNCPCAGEEFGICQADDKNRACEWYKIPSWCPLKPMPIKRETIVHWKSIGGGDIPTHEISDYDKGWNDCIEFLEGEENE